MKLHQWRINYVSFECRLQGTCWYFLHLPAAGGHDGDCLLPHEHDDHLKYGIWVLRGLGQRIYVCPPRTHQYGRLHDLCAERDIHSHLRCNRVAATRDDCSDHMQRAWRRPCHLVSCVCGCWGSSWCVWVLAGVCHSMQGERLPCTTLLLGKKKRTNTARSPHQCDCCNSRVVLTHKNTFSCLIYVPLLSVLTHCILCIVPYFTSVQFTTNLMLLVCSSRCYMY
jgi:hypothetical protein